MTRMASIGTLLLAASVSAAPVRKQPSQDSEIVACSRNGEVVISSVHNGALPLYRMEQDGKNLRPLPNAAAKNATGKGCLRVVWRVPAGIERHRAKDATSVELLSLYVATYGESWSLQHLKTGVYISDPPEPSEASPPELRSSLQDLRVREFEIWSTGPRAKRLERIGPDEPLAGLPVFSTGPKLAVFAGPPVHPKGSR